MADDGYTYVFQGTGSLHDLRGPEDAPRPRTVAVLWVPDPEQRHGWREFYVRREAEPAKPGGKPFGFDGREGG